MIRRPHACLRLRPTPGYGRDYFRAGFDRLDYDCDDRPKRHPEPGDVLVLWNRKRPDEDFAQAYERAGAAVLVAENGYIGHDGTGGKLFALALGHHAGAGIWPDGSDDPDRWRRQGITLKPWRREGSFILVLPQRGIGERGVAMPTGWLPEITARLKAVTTREIRVRRHPGAVHGERLEPTRDIVGAWAALTYSSGAGLKCLAEGIPVFAGRSTWIGAGAARIGYDDIERPFLGDRVPMFRRLAHAQFSKSELASGDAFTRVLACRNS